MSTLTRPDAPHRSAPPDVSAIRARFPALAGETVYLDNAGGSQVPACVADAVREYMLTSYVQLGAEYGVSRRSSEVVALAHDWIRVVMNGGESGSPGAGRVILGASTSALARMLSDCYERSFDPARPEIIVSVACHESTIGPWMRLERLGWRVRLWGLEGGEGTPAGFSAAGLEPLLSSRTRLVVFPHVSNIFGGIADAAAIVGLARQAGARTLVDGVAYAPHRAMDVQAVGADWYVYSAYKVFGPHMAALFGTHHAMAELVGPNHYFIPAGEVPRKFELGGVSHEGCAALLALGPYLRFLAGEPEGSWDRPPGRGTVERAMEAMEALETPLQERLLAGLRKDPRVRVIGPASGGPERVATISFVPSHRRSSEVARALNAQGLGVRFGNFYSYRLCERLGLDPAEGVVRVSLAHYNTESEVDRTLAALDAVL